MCEVSLWTLFVSCRCNPHIFDSIISYSYHLSEAGTTPEPWQGSPNVKCPQGIWEFLLRLQSGPKARYPLQQSSVAGPVRRGLKHVVRR